MPDLRDALRREFPPGALLVYALIVLMTTTEGTLLLLFPLYLDRSGYALSLVGVLVSLLFVSRLVSRLPVGALYGAARAKRQLALALLGLSVATGGFALAGGQLLPVVVLAVAHGLSFGALGTLVLASFIDLTGGHRAGAIMAWYTAVLSTGYAIGAFLGGALADAYGIETTLALVSILPIVAIGVVLSLPEFHGPPPTHARAAGLRGSLAAVRRMDPRVWLAFAIVLYVNLISDAVDAFLPLFGLAAGLTLAEVGALKGLKSASATAIRFASLGIMRMVDSHVLDFWGVVLMAVATFAIPFVGGFAPLAAVFVAIGLCRGILRVTSAATVAELGREGKDVGLASGIYNAGLDVGAILGPTLGGVIASAVGIPLMFQLMAVVSVAAYFGVALSTAAGRSTLTARGGRRSASAR